MFQVIVQTVENSLMMSVFPKPKSKLASVLTGVPYKDLEDNLHPFNFSILPNGDGWFQQDNFLSCATDPKWFQLTCM